MDHPEFCQLPLGRHFAVLSKMYFGVLLKKLDAIELDRYYSLLLMIEKASCKCTQQYLADQSHIDKTQLVRIIDDMIKKEFIVKHQNKNDRREYILQLTDKSKSLLPQIKAATKALNDHVLQDFSEEEKDVFFRGMEKIYQQLTDEPSHPVIFNFKKSKKSNR